MKFPMSSSLTPSLPRSVIGHHHRLYLLWKNLIINLENVFSDLENSLQLNPKSPCAFSIFSLLVLIQPILMLLQSQINFSTTSIRCFGVFLICKKSQWPMEYKLLRFDHHSDFLNEIWKFWRHYRSSWNFLWVEVWFFHIVGKIFQKMFFKIFIIIIIILFKWGQ